MAKSEDVQNVGQVLLDLIDKQIQERLESFVDDELSDLITEVVEDILAEKAQENEQ